MLLPRKVKSQKELIIVWKLRLAAYWSYEENRRERETHESENASNDVGDSHDRGPFNPFSDLGSSPNRTKQVRYGRHEVGDGHDDAIATSSIDDGVHGKHGRLCQNKRFKPGPLDVEFARATVAELRHSLDAIESLHQKHMGTMSAEVQSKMQMMMEKMDKDRSMLKDQVAALETDVQADKPDSKQVAAHVNALLKQLGMMSQNGWRYESRKQKGPDENEDVGLCDRRSNE